MNYELKLKVVEHSKEYMGVVSSSMGEDAMGGCHVSFSVNP
jgi:hypothetical protein